MTSISSPPSEPVSAAASLCARCKTSPGTITGRNDPLCSTCFISYARSKPIKRMDPFRVRNTPSNSPPPLLLLPLSFGASSLTLLHICSEQLASQRSRVKRTGYELLVVWVDDGGVTGDEAGSSKRRDLFKQLEEKYGEEGTCVRFKVVRLEEVYDYGSRLQGEPEFGVGPSLEKLRALIGALPSLSSQQDILTIFLNRLLILLAIHHKCPAILYSHSTTRLAEKTLSETAKGRGYSVPWSTADGVLPLNIPHTTREEQPEVRILYPLRDLLKKELVTYISLTPSLTPFHIPDTQSINAIVIPTSAKDTTIDSLMKQYFAGMEEQYPSIVANVVKTIGRVPAPTLTQHNSSLETETRLGLETAPPNCGICGFSIDIDEGEVWEEEDREGKKLSENTLRELGLEVDDLCGGCRRTVDGVKGGAGIRWPL